MTSDTELNHAYMLISGVKPHYDLGLRILKFNLIDI